MSLAVLRDSKPYPVAASIVQKLQAHGYRRLFCRRQHPGCASEIPPKDIDIATSARPEQVQETFPQDNSRRSPIRGGARPGGRYGI